MPRNGSGVYSLPEPAFVAQTLISSTAVNSDLSDIATALTGSLPRDGQAGMTGTIPLATGGFNYTVDPNTGMKRTAADEQVIYCGGVNVVKVTPAGVFDGVSGAALGFVIGVPYLWILPTVPTGCVFPIGQACTSSYPVLRALLIAAGSPYGTTGSDPNFPDMRGVTVAGVDSSRGILTGGTLGAFLGTETVALVEANNGPHTHTGTTGTESNTHTHTVNGTTSIESVGHTHFTSGTTGGMNSNTSHTHDMNYNTNFRGNDSTIGGGSIGSGGQSLVNLNSSYLSNQSTNIDHTHSFSATSGGQSANHTHTFAATSAIEGATHTHNIITASSGSGTPHSNVQPTLVLNWIMRAA